RVLSAVAAQGEQFLSQAPDDAELSRELARAYADLGQAQNAVGNQPQALASTDRAVELFGILAARRQREPAHRLELARCYAQRGDLHRQSLDLVTGLADLARARGLYEQLIADDSELDGVSCGLAECCLSEANIRMHRDTVPTTLAVLRKGLDAAGEAL